MNTLELSITPSISSKKPFLIKGLRVSHSGGKGGQGGARGAPYPSNTFLRNPLPSKPMPPMGHPQLKNEAPII